MGKYNKKRVKLRVETSDGEYRLVREIRGRKDEVIAVSTDKNDLSDDIVFFGEKYLNDKFYYKLIVEFKKL